MRTFVYFILILSLLACTSAKPVSTSILKNETFKRIHKNMPIQIQSDWAQPQVTAAFGQLSGTGLIPLGSTIGNINIIGTTNYLQVKDSIVKAYFPFYGERQFGGSIGGNQNGIEFDGVSENFRTSKGKKNSYEIRFNINDKNTPSENYDVYVQIFPNLSSSIQLNSSHRSSIRYRGEANILKNDEN